MTRYSTTMRDLLEQVRAREDNLLKPLTEAKTVKREQDEPATPDEGSMASDQLKFIVYAANEIMQHIQGGGEFPEWMQNKLSGTHEQMKGLHANIDHSNVESVKEELDLDELKMDDPKLVRAFDKMKKGDTIKLKTSSTISKGTDFVDYVVKSKNVVNKGRVEKITLATKGNEGSVKKFLYKRDGKVTFAIGDMGASIDDIKEGTWALPDSPKAKDALKKLMSKPIKLGKEGDDASDKLYALIGDDELFDDLYVAGKKNPNGDARDIVKKHMKRLGIKEEVELEEAMLNLKLVTYQAKEALGKIRHKVAQKGGKYIISVDSNDEEDAQKAMKDHPLYVAGKLRVVPESVEEGVEPIQWPSQPLEEKLKVSDGLGAWIDDFKKSDAPQFKGKSDEEKKNMAIAAFTDAGGKLESVEEAVDAKKVVAYLVKKGNNPKEAESMVKKELAGAIKAYPNAPVAKIADYIRSVAEETELDEAPKMKYALVGTDMKIYSMGSDERDLRLDRKSLEKRFKDVAPLKMARLKTAQSIGDKVDKSQLKEEETPANDQAKKVDQGKEDQKKTRIAQLQLQIAKAQETINKINRASEIEKMRKGE